MTRFAFGAKCGGFAASGSVRRAAGLAPAVGPSRSASATAPRPTPHCCKNQRRVMFRWTDVMMAILGSFYLADEEVHQFQPVRRLERDRARAGHEIGFPPGLAVDRVRDAALADGHDASIPLP